jgi:hypothetical protein
MQSKLQALPKFNAIMLKPIKGFLENGIESNDSTEDPQLLATIHFPVSPFAIKLMPSALVVIMNVSCKIGCQPDLYV